MLTSLDLIVTVASHEEAQESKEEMEGQKDASIIVEQDTVAAADPNDFIMVRSKVAPVLLPVHKGLMPHHPRAPVPMAPPGLPPPAQSPLPFQTFLEVTLPQHYPFRPNDIYTHNTIASNALIFLVEYIWTHDPTAMIAKFPSQANDNLALLPIAPRGTRQYEFPNTVQTVSYYLHQGRFHPSGAATKAKILLLHSVETDKLLKDLNTKGSYGFVPSPIQYADVISTAWLLGSTEHTNCKDLAAKILQTPEFQARPEVGLILRQKWVKLYPQERRPSDIFAAHVYTAKHHYMFVLATLQKLYNQNEQQSTGDRFAYGKYYVVPDAISYRYMHDTAAPKDLDNDQLHHQRRYQRQVLQNCTSKSMDLVGLVPYGGSLWLPKAQLLAPINVPEVVDRVLRVDRHPLRAFTYTFSWHQKYTKEAMAAISTRLWSD